MKLDSTAKEQPSEIQAVPLKHPWRWVTAVILLALLVWFIIGAATNEAYHWDTYFQYVLDTRVAIAALRTIALTVFPC